MQNNKGNIAVFFQREKKNPRWPDARGTVSLSRDLVEEIKNAPENERGMVDLSISLWSKTGPKAGKYLSGAVELAVERGQRSGGSSGSSSSTSEDDIPF